MNKASEILKELHSKDIHDLMELNIDHVKVYEAIAELEEAMKPKTCDGCYWSEDDSCCDGICGKCLRNDELRDMYEPKDNA